ncbi:S8 family serine peptidase [Flavobacterium crassostreae]|uniref:Peptidase S8 n=1 Tax=Flavobacterium crassostreae TaxID=1763534 RepID=A0A1B9E0M5_9FLAO|nr:S8 family serine peptidase [Flavobacterium crassostreae]OCB75457.1 peptidase S8 [Flavobacterium crassostreae]
MKNFILLLLLTTTTITFAQQDAWVYFKPKTNSEFYYNSPLEMLTQRAIDRRTNQNIPLDLKDIPIDKTYISQIKSTNGISVMAKSKWLNAIHVRGTQNAINSLKSKSFVEKVDFANKNLNAANGTMPPVLTNASRTKKLAKKTNTAVDYNYGNSANQIEMLKGHLLHKQNYTGSGKIIAVLDAGFPGVNTIAPFKRLLGEGKILGGYNFVDRNDNFYTGDSHGTSVLSTMAGYEANKLVGTAPDASYYLFITENVNAENPVEESLWVEAAERADSLGVDVINSSLGYFDYDDTNYSYTYQQMDGKTAFVSRGAEIACSRGMVVVISAGNSGDTVNPHIAVPADAPSALTIGAVNSSKMYASFSSIGPSFDNRVKPEVMAQGAATVLSNQYGSITTSNGTSFSGPIIAGMVASLWQALPNKTSKEIKQIILESSDRFINPNAQYGYGIPDFNLAITKNLATTDFNAKEANFYIYPNPTTDFVQVTITDGFTKGMLYFYNELGQKVLEKELASSSNFISLQSLRTGIYFYNFKTDTYTTSGKIIKQ